MGRYKNKKDYKKQGAERINPEMAKPYNVEYAELAQRLVATGANQADLAFLLGTSETNLKNWKRQYPEFKRAINKGKELTLSYLIGKGIKSAAGFTYTDRIVEKTGRIDESGNLVEDEEQRVKIKEITKTQPPNEKLLMFLASALDRQLNQDNWRNRQFIEAKSEKTVKFQIDATSVAEQIDKLSGGLRKYVTSHELPQEMLEANFEHDIDTVSENIEERTDATESDSE